MREHPKYRRCSSSSWLRLWMCHSCHWSLGWHQPRSFTRLSWLLTAWIGFLCCWMGLWAEMITYRGRTAGTNFIREELLVAAEWKANISHVEVVSLHDPSLWMLLCILQLFVLWLVARFTAGCSNESHGKEPSQATKVWISFRRGEEKHITAFFGAPSKCIPDRFPPLVFNSFPFLCMELAVPVCLDNFYDADPKWDPALRSGLKCLPVSECRNPCLNKRRFRTWFSHLNRGVKCCLRSPGVSNIHQGFVSVMFIYSTSFPLFVRAG